jgi:hypothetical protein
VDFTHQSINQSLILVTDFTPRPKGGTNKLGCSTLLVISSMLFTHPFFFVLLRASTSHVNDQTINN